MFHGKADNQDLHLDLALGSVQDHPNDRVRELIQGQGHLLQINRFLHHVMVACDPEVLLCNLDLQVRSLCLFQMRLSLPSLHFQLLPFRLSVQVLLHLLHLLH
jgi:hypothetical protein